MLRKTFYLLLAGLAWSGFAQAQDIDARSRAKAQADTSVRVDPDGSVSVQSRAKAEAESSVTIGAPPPLEAPQRRISEPKRAGRDQMPAGAPPPAVPQRNAAGHEMIFLDEQALVDPAAPPRPRPPLPCKKTVEAISGELKISIINNYCVVKITIQKLWREGGKTHVQFDADNAKGGQQANLRLVEQWADRSGRAIADPIDDQKIAIGKGRNTIFSVSGPTPAAITGTITLYR